MKRYAYWGFVLAFTVALPASAEEEFPAAIQMAGNMPCGPSCLLCHTAIPGSIQNLKQPFGLAVLRSGVIPRNPGSFVSVIANLRASKSDVDNDGALDVDELVAGTNPNDPAADADLCGPTYGCGAHIVQAPPPTGVGVLWCIASGVGLAVVISARRRRAARR